DEATGPRTPRGRCLEAWRGCHRPSCSFADPYESLSFGEIGKLEPPSRDAAGLLAIRLESQPAIMLAHHRVARRRSIFAEQRRRPGAPCRVGQNVQTRRLGAA